LNSDIAFISYIAQNLAQHCTTAQARASIVGGPAHSQYLDTSCWVAKTAMDKCSNPLTENHITDIKEKAEKRPKNVLACLLCYCSMRSVLEIWHLVLCIHSALSFRPYNI